MTMIPSTRNFTVLYTNRSVDAPALQSAASISFLVILVLYRATMSGMRARSLISLLDTTILATTVSTGDIEMAVFPVR
jgi:hypothetical protein